MKQKILTILLASAAFLLALGMTLYPLISNYVNQKYASAIYFSYEEAVELTDNSQLEEARESAKRYNEAITPGAMEFLDSFSQEALIEAASDYDSLLNIAGNGIMGYVEIPIISVNLPIYHGTGMESLERGIGHLLGSSLPVGGTSTHAVLTGHSGMANNKMFTDLEQLHEGDVFYLHVLGEHLAYQVCALNTVEPHETDLLSIIPGEDYCTLVTCTPYGINSHRLLVRGSRIPYEEAEAIVEEIAVEEIPASKWETKYYEGIFLGIGTVVIMAAVAFAAASLARLLHPRKRRGGKYLR